MAMRVWGVVVLLVVAACGDGGQEASGEHGLDVPGLGPGDGGAGDGASADGAGAADGGTDVSTDAAPDAAVADAAPTDAGPPGDATADGGSDALADAWQPDAIADGGSGEDADAADTAHLADAADTAHVADSGDVADTGHSADAGPDDAGGAPDAGPDATDPDTADTAAVDTGALGPSVRLNEIACAGDDWIELLADAPADLAGYVLTDSPGDPAKSLTFASQPLAPGQHFVVAEPDLPFGVKCGDDTVWLLRPDGSVADSVDVPSLPPGATWGRLPDHAGDPAATKPTPGAPNVPFVEPPPVDADAMFDPLSVATVDLWVAPEGLAALWQDPYTYVDGKLRFALADGTTTPVLDVGVRLKGRWGSFRDLNGKSAFKVKLNHVVKGQTLFGQKKLTLNNMVQDASMVHESVSYALLRELGLPAPRTGYAWVRLNNRDFGLYLNLEPYDDIFAAAHFPSTQHIFEGAYGVDVIPSEAKDLEVDEGDEDALADLDALVAAGQAQPGGAWAKAMALVADVEELAAMWAFEIWIGHWDGYAPTINNYYLHSDEGGRFSMMTCGTDQTFSSHLGWHDGAAHLFQGCMATPSCRDAFDLAMAQIAPAVSAMQLTAYAQEVAAAIAPYVEADPRRPYSVGTHQGAVAATVAFITKRQGDSAKAFGCLLGDDPDPDGDGFTCSEDCDNEDPAVHPGATDACGDGVDQDCSGYADDTPGCPDWKEVYWGETRYLVTSTPRTWQAAREHCQAAGSDLVVLGSAAEQAWLWQNAPGVAGSDRWLGLSDLAVEGTFVWVDGTVASGWGWASGEPNDWGGNEDCAELWGNGTWNDLDCNAALRAICEDPCAPGVDADGDGYDACGEDCDDGDPAIHPGVTDVCLDGVDQDCSGVPDDGPGCVPGCVGLPGAGMSAAVCTGLLGWADARAACKSMGADLATFASKAEQDAAVAALKSAAPGVQDAWIGLGDQANEGTYLWVDGTKPSYTSWAGGQPNNSGDQDCVRLYPTSQWNDTACSEGHARVCRWPAKAPAVLPLCVPQCAGVCGDDGCGGSCGACAEGLVCEQGQCVEPKPSCAEACGGQSPAGCWCDEACADYGDCCPDYTDVCAVSAPSASCEGACGGQAEAGCWCDQACTSYGDCCEDYGTVCIGSELSCGGWCGGMAPGGCYCDEPCALFHDCCPDKGAQCGGCGCAGECGDDGCGGSCGACPAGEVCDGGACVADGTAAGCAATDEAGCGGCPCEACVCEADVFCCYVAWDPACASRCATDCAPSGCAAP